MKITSLLAVSFHRSEAGSVVGRTFRWEVFGNFFLTKLQSLQVTYTYLLVYLYLRGTTNQAHGLTRIDNLLLRRAPYAGTAVFKQYPPTTSTHILKKSFLTIAHLQHSIFFVFFPSVLQSNQLFHSCREHLHRRSVDHYFCRQNFRRFFAVFFSSYNSAVTLYCVRSNGHHMFPSGARVTSLDIASSRHG